MWLIHAAIALFIMTTTVTAIVRSVSLSLTHTQRDVVVILCSTTNWFLSILSLRYVYVVRSKLSSAQKQKQKIFPWNWQTFWDVSGRLDFSSFLFLFILTSYETQILISILCFFFVSFLLAAFRLAGVLIYEMLVGYPPFYADNPFGIYEKILNGKYEWPRLMDPVAKDLVKKLLVPDRVKRLGNMKNGAEDVRRHRWFKHLDWDDVYNRRITVSNMFLSLSLFSVFYSMFPFDHL